MIATAYYVNPEDEARNVKRDPEPNVEADNFAEFDDFDCNEFEEFTDEDQEDFVNKAKNAFKKFWDYVGSEDFKEDLNEKSKKLHVPPKRLAKNFFEKALSILGDVVGTAFAIGANILDTLVTVMERIARGAVEIFARAGEALSRFISLNHTNYAAI